MDDDRGAPPAWVSRHPTPILRYARRPNSRGGGLRLGHRRWGVPPLLGRRGCGVGRVGLTRHCGAGPHRRSPGIRHRGSVGVGRRIVVRHRDQGGHGRDVTGSRQCHRIEPTADRSGMVRGHPHLLGETQASAGHARRNGLGDNHAHHRHSCDAPYLLSCNRYTSCWRRV